MRSVRGERSRAALRAAVTCVVAFLSLSSPGCADPNHFSNAISTDEFLRGARPTYWSAEDPETGGRAHLLGSIHVGPKEGWLLPDTITSDFDHADVLVVEIDARDIEPTAMDHLILEFALLPTNESLRDRISPELYAALRERLEAEELTIMGLDRLKPWMVAISLQAMEMSRQGYDADSGIDLALLKRAGDGMTVIELETLRGQISMMDAMTPGAQESMLEEVLTQSAEMETYLKELIAAWRSGNDAKLEELLLDASNEGPDQEAFYQALIYDRNARMSKRIEELLATGRNHFVVIGAAHMVGEQGIPAALRGAGMKVERLQHPTPLGE